MNFIGFLPQYGSLAKVRKAVTLGTFRYVPTANLVANMVSLLHHNDIRPSPVVVGCVGLETKNANGGKLPIRSSNWSFRF